MFEENLGKLCNLSLAFFSFSFFFSFYFFHCRISFSFFLGEYGFGEFSPDTDTHISFKTVFEDAPNVTLALRGFEAHLDVDSYDVYDRLDIEKFVQNVNETGFDIIAIDRSEGMVEVKHVYCSWMACQKLDEDVELNGI